MVRAISEEQLLDALCRILVEVGGYRMAWVGFARTDPARSVAVKASAGASQSYLDEIRVSWADDELGQGPTGLAIRTGEIHLNRDSATNAAFGPWREQALRHGFASSIAVPLRLEGQTFGALAVYATEADAFDDHERDLLLHFAEDLAFAIGALRSRQALEVRDQQLRQAAKMEVVGRLTSEIVHDFNNLLAVVQSCGLELATTLPGGTPSHAIAQDIVAAGRRAAELTARVLTLGRAGTPRARAQQAGPVVLGLQPLLARILGRGIELEVVIASDCGDIEIDAGHLEQVLMNLAVNARDAMPGGGRLSVQLANTGTIPAGALPAGAGLERALELRVRDTGSGMSPEVVHQIFEPFFTTKPEGRGTGLGLAVTRGIVEHYRGQIAVESELGVGTTFRVFLPLAGPASTPGPATTPG
jgi:signal transduction histidine kinase